MASQKIIAVMITNMTQKCSTMSSGNTFTLGSKGQRSTPRVIKMLPTCVYALLLLIVYRRHRLRAVRRCGLLLQMSNIAWSVCLSVCVLGTRVSCAKTAEAFGTKVQTHVGPGNISSDRGSRSHMEKDTFEVK